MKIIGYFCCSLLLMTASSFAHAEANEDAFENGKQLHNRKCLSCHAHKSDENANKRLYTRKDRKMTSLGGLRSQVRRCNNALAQHLRLSEDGLHDVVTYLNKEFYKFEETTD